VTAAVPSGIEAQANSAVSVLRTLVLCDLADSTALVERLGDQKAAELIRKHDRFARALMLQHGAQEIDKTDGFLLMFERPIQAVAFALAYQRDLAALNTQEKANIAARFGIHVGDVVMWDNAPGDVQRGAKLTEVEGLVKPVAARLMQLALPGQILLSGVAYEIARRAQGELGEKLEDVHWRTHGRYRFKGLPDPVPVFEVGERGIAPLKPPPWSSKAHRETPIWRRPLAVGIESIALLLLVALPIFYLTRPAPAIAFANRDWVVVGDLKNLTGEAVFDNSLQTAFRVGLEQSRYVNVVPDLQVRGTLKRMEREAATRIDRGVGSEIALREGARALVLPTVAEIGGRVRLTAEVIDPTTQTSVYSDSVDGSGEDSVLPSMDELLRKMRERLGESLASIGETSAPLAEVTTKNLDALKAFSVGQQALVDGKGGEAMSLFGQAIELDPDFALAHLARGGIYLSTGQKGKGHADIVLAMRDVKRLSARERLLAEANAAWFDTPATMREKWSLFTRLHPDDAAGAQNLALVYWWYDNDLTQAARYFSTVTASQHPRRGASWLFLGDTQIAREQFADAATSYAKAREVGSPQLYLDPINRFIATRDDAGARQALAKEDTHAFAFFEVEKQLRSAAVEAGRGRLSVARAAADAAAQTADRAKLETSRQRARLAALSLAFAAGDAAAPAALKDYVGEELRRVEASSDTYDLSPYTHLSLAAMLALRHGDHALAERILGALQAKAETGGYFSLEQPYRIAACESGIERDAAKAVSCLEGLLSDRAYFQTRVALLRAYRAAGNDAQALATADWLARHRGNATAEFLAEFSGQVPNLLDSDAAIVDAAELELKAGNTDDARKRLAGFTTAWAPAEGDPPLLRRARQLEVRSGHEENR